ncbi:MAG: hypothetical protein BMS9Abin37_1888 [Acidobacteriota bacterium]|nr:MAG: hypothetical protein BMS9Abin37_1888 [Acidobacteriota bacterium]
MCVQGARWVQTNILDAKPDAAIHVYAIFFEIVAGDKGAKYEVDPREMLDDPRVTHFWDERRLTGRWFDENVTRIGKRTGEEGRIEWDTFILYDDRAEWTDEPPRTVSWGRPVIQEKTRLLRDLEKALNRRPE